MATAPTFVGAAASGDTSSGNPSGSIPAGVVAGDLLIAALVSGGGTISAVPAGWTLLTSSTPGTGSLFIYTKVATGSDPNPSWTATATQWAVSVSAYRGASAVDSYYVANAASALNLEAPSLAFNYAATRRVSIFAGFSSVSNISFSTPAGMTERVDFPSSLFLAMAVDDESYTVPGSTGARTATANATLDRGFAATLTFGVNSSPNAPLQTGPADGATIDRSITQRFAWSFSDPDAGDTQSRYDLRYRIVGSPTWTTITGSTPSQFSDFAAGTLAAGDYEWQVRTDDQGGATGSYSGSAFFTAATPTGVPTITAPTSGGTVGASSALVTWSTAGGQDGYQIRRVADDAGAPDTATVYYDTGEVTSVAARSATVPFETNDRYEHIQIRVKLDGLWSSWASIRVLVSYTPPETPTVELAADNGTGSILVTITNPTPGAGVPAVTYNDVYVDDGDGEERRATDLPTNTAWRYWTPVSGRDYATAVRVVAVGDNGTTSSSS